MDSVISYYNFPLPLCYTLFMTEYRAVTVVDGHYNDSCLPPDCDFSVQFDQQSAAGSLNLKLKLEAYSTSL